MASQRLEIAEVAAVATERCDGVAALLDAQVTASSAGAYAVDVHVCAHPTQFQELGEAIRRTVRAEAESAGLGDAVGPITAHIDALREPGEVGPA